MDITGKALDILGYLRDEIYLGELEVHLKGKKAYAYNDTDYYSIFLPDFARGDCSMAVILENGRVSYQVAVIRNSEEVPYLEIVTDLERKFDLYSMVCDIG